MCLEVVILSVNFNFILTSLYLNDILGQVLCLFLLLVTAAESALGLALFVSFCKYHNRSVHYYFF
jgi:NADH-quinone oxidoreductase subunit K